MDAVIGRHETGRAGFGTGTSIVCKALMEQEGVHFPDAHLDPEKMAALAMAGHTVLGFDVVMPLFSVCHEAAAMGCDVHWGGPNAMPEPGKSIYSSADDIRIPADLLRQSPCRVPLAAISLLKKRLGEDAGVCGKVMGSWTLAYHLFGVENFLIGTIDDPSETHRILERLAPVTLSFARAQIEAGADCLLLADHATRDLCSPNAYGEFLMRMHRQIAAELPVPLILHICGDTTDRIGLVNRTGLACFHWDTKCGPPSKVRDLAGDKLALMGGVSNFLLLDGTPEQVAAAAAEAVTAGIDIVGPECAVPLGTPLANLKAIATVDRLGGRE